MQLPLSDCVGVQVVVVAAAVPVALGGNEDIMVVIILIEDVLTLLMMLKEYCQSAFRCCVVRVSRFPLPLPLSDRVPVVVVADAVMFQLRLEGRTCWQYS